MYPAKSARAVLPIPHPSHNILNLLLLFFSGEIVVIISSHVCLLYVANSCKADCSTLNPQQPSLALNRYQIHVWWIKVACSLNTPLDPHLWVSADLSPSLEHLYFYLIFYFSPSRNRFRHSSSPLLQLFPPQGLGNLVFPFQECSHPRYSHHLLSHFNLFRNPCPPFKNSLILHSIFVCLLLAVSSIATSLQRGQDCLIHHCISKSLKVSGTFVYLAFIEHLLRARSRCWRLSGNKTDKNTLPFTFWKGKTIHKVNN